MHFWDPLIEDISVTIDEPFEIIFEQQPILYLAWEPDIPNYIELTDKKINFKDLVDVITATFICHEPGDHIMTFNYRKQCCDHRLVSTRVYNIHVSES